MRFERRTRAADAPTDSELPLVFSLSLEHRTQTGPALSDRFVYVDIRRVTREFVLKDARQIDPL